MRLRLWLPMTLAVAAAQPVLAQQTRRPAEVMPAKVLAYVELREPGRIVKEITSLFEGSVLGNVPDSLAPLRNKYASTSRGGGPDEMAIAGMVLAPEIAAELGRIPGAAIAITGIDKETKEMPEFIAVILPGDSNLAPLMMRMAITATGFGSSSFGPGGQKHYEARGGFEPAGEVEGVRIYRLVERRRTFTEGATAPKEEVRTLGPAVAMMPEALIVGSTVHVKEVIGRIKGKVQGPSLASTPAYKDANQAMGERPGVFAFGDAKAILGMVDQLPLGPQEREAFAKVKQLVNPAVLESVSQHLSLEKGTLRYRWQARLDPKEKSRVLDLLPPTGLKPELLQFVPQDSMVVAAIANTDGGERLKKLLTLADDIFQAAGERGRPPSQEFAQLEPMLGLAVGKDVVAKVQGVAVAVAGPNWFRALVPPVVVIVQATDEQSAKTLADETLPKILSLATQQPDLKPQEREVQGKALSVVPLFGLFGLCYGREGSTLVLGGYPELVADVLINGPKKKGLLADEKFAAALKPEETIIFLAVKPLTLASAALPMATPMMATGAFGKPAPGVPGMASMNKIMKDLQQLAKHDEPFIFNVSRTPDRITAEVTLGGLKQTVPRATDIAVEMYYQMQGQYGARPAPPTFKPSAPVPVKSPVQKP